jgi:predicted O-methyltransferase YrrM
MGLTGQAALHTARYLLGLDRAATQTSAAERETIARFARGRRQALEIGVFEGATTALIAKEIATDGTLFGVDPFFAGRLGICWGKIIAEREVNRAGVGRKVVLVRSLSHDAAVQIANDSFDFMFLDGDHSLRAIAQDWADWSGRVATGGVMLLHDTQVPPHNPRVRELGSYLYFQDTISRDSRFELLETVDSLSVLRRK